MYMNNENILLNKLDLNIGLKLNWDVSKAILELVYNAWDEVQLNNSTHFDVEINEREIIISNYTDKGKFLMPDHFLIDPDDFKKGNKAVMGRYGTGLKKALAILVKREYEINIESGYHIYKVIVERKDNTTVNAVKIKLEELKGIIFSGTKITIMSKNNISNTIINHLTKRVFNLKYPHNKNTIVENGNHDFAINNLIIENNPNLLFSYNFIYNEALLKRPEKNDIRFNGLQYRELIHELIYINLDTNTRSFYNKLFNLNNLEDYKIELDCIAGFENILELYKDILICTKEEEKVISEILKYTNKVLVIHENYKKTYYELENTNERIGKNFIKNNLTENYININEPTDIEQQILDKLPCLLERIGIYETYKVEIYKIVYKDNKYVSSSIDIKRKIISLQRNTLESLSRFAKFVLIVAIQTYKIDINLPADKYAEKLISEIIDNIV